MGPKSLIGKRSLGAAQFRLNTQYPTGTSLASKVGYFGLGVHRTLNLALEPTYGQPAWQEFIRSVMAAMGTVHTGTGAIPYYDHQASAYLVQCYMIDLQIKELQRAIKMLDWSWPTTLEAMKDFWGPSEQDAIQARSIKSQICNKLNAYADTFYTTYPFIKPAFIGFLGDLLSKVYRDDKDKRTNFIYFNLFDKPWDLVQAGSYFDNAFNRLDIWLNPNNSSHAAQSVFGILKATTSPTPNTLPLLIGDIRAVYGDRANQSLPLIFPEDPVQVDFDQDLINSLNASPTGDVEWNVLNAGGGWNALSLEAQASGFTWNVTREQLLTWAQSTYLTSITQGPVWNTHVFATWGSTSLQSAAAWQDLAVAVNNKVWDYPVYHGFDGETILSDFCFTTIWRVDTYPTVNPTAFDPSPDFLQADRTAAFERYGLFGIYITDTVSYVMAANGSWNLLYGQGYNIWHISLGATFQPRFTVPLVANNAMRTIFNLNTNARQMAYTMDAMTNWEFIFHKPTNTYGVVTDEDVDEWTILPTVDLIGNYGATAKGMFESDTTITRQSNKVEDVSLLERSSGYSVKRDKREGYSYGKGKGQKRRK